MHASVECDANHVLKLMKQEQIVVSLNHANQQSKTKQRQARLLRAESGEPNVEHIDKCKLNQ